jgi:hypothetical protein
MDRREAAEIVVAINQFDTHVQSNAVADAIWFKALQPFSRELAWEAVVEHYTLNDAVSATPSMIRKRATAMASRFEAKERALTAQPAITAIKNPNSFRARNPELWDQLFEEGRKQGNEERMRNAAKLNTQKADSEEAREGNLTQFNYQPNQYTDWAEYEDPSAA